MFSQDPPAGVYSGMILWANSQQTNSGVLWPAKLSGTKSTRSGGNSSSRAGLIDRPSNHRPQAERRPVAGSAGGPGIAAWLPVITIAGHPDSSRTPDAAGPMGSFSQRGRPCRKGLTWDDEALPSTACIPAAWAIES